MNRVVSYYDNEPSSSMVLISLKWKCKSHTVRNWRNGVMNSLYVKFVLVSSVVLTVQIVNGIENNVKCRDLKCGFNPDDYLTVPQIIKRHGYPSESHIVSTLDGYLLTVFRIPGSKSGKKGGSPVLLQHGLSGDSAPWVICDNNSLGKFIYFSFSND